MVVPAVASSSQDVGIKSGNITQKEGDNQMGTKRKLTGAQLTQSLAGEAIERFKIDQKYLKSVNSLYLLFRIDVWKAVRRLRHESLASIIASAPGYRQTRSLEILPKDVQPSRLTGVALLYALMPSSNSTYLKRPIDGLSILRELAVAAIITKIWDLLCFHNNLCPICCCENINPSKCSSCGCDTSKIVVDMPEYCPLCKHEVIEGKCTNCFYKDE
jgi:hypothetical protein